MPNSGFTAIAAGKFHSLGLKEDGSIVDWGKWLGQYYVPSPNRGYIAIAAGSDHSLALRQDGSIVAWGFNWNGQCNVPSPNSGFTAIAARTDHSLGLKQDGSIVAWGSNETGQCHIPWPNTGYVAVAAGGSYSPGLSPLAHIPTQAEYSGGTGVLNDPYQIATAGDLMLLGENPDNYDKYFILTANIDLDPNLPGRKVFDKAVISPDWDSTKGDFQGVPFAGAFDGNGHVISI